MDRRNAWYPLAELVESIFDMVNWPAREIIDIL